MKLSTCIGSNVYTMHAQICKFATLKVKVLACPCSKNVSAPKLGYLKFDFKTISHKWLPYWDAVSQATFGSLPWVKVTAWPCSKNVRPITWLFEVGFYSYFTEMITILRWCVTTLPIVWLCAYYTALLNSQFQWSTRTFWGTGRGLLYCPQCYQMLVFLNVGCVLVFYVFLYCSVCFLCTGHFFMVPLYLTCLHCLQHSFFEHLFNWYSSWLW